MATHKHQVIFKNDTISLTESNNGFWLYDETRGMNLSMRAKNEREAWVEAIIYYQQRLTTTESSYNGLKSRVESFMTGEGWEEIDQGKNDFYMNYR